MDLINSLKVSYSNIYLLAGAAIALYTIYGTGLVIYRLFLSPISHIPGPKLAAATLWYEFYYNVILGGTFFLHIQELHKQYGPIVRITPREIHIDDPEFYDTIYSASERRDKTSFHARPYNTKTSAFSTPSHDHHRLRRSMLNPFFSKSLIRNFAPWIQDRADILCRRFQDEYKGTEKVLCLNDAFACLTNDTVMEYSFAEHYDFSSKARDFRADMNVTLEVYLRMIHVLLNFPFMLKLQIDILPRWLVTWMDPQSRIIFEFMDDLERQITAQMTGASQNHVDATHPTIFNEILQSKRPASEKSKQRLFDESQVIVSAGVETTATALSTGMFYLLSDEERLEKLRKELLQVWTDVESPPSLTQLETLPYLTACAHEALRISYGPVARLPRISPDKTHTYTAPGTHATYALPPGTIMSMSNYTLHQNASIFPEPNRFIPERWLPDPQTGEPAKAGSAGGAGVKGEGSPLTRYLGAFSKGSRACLGMNLAWAELYIALANVVRRNEFVLYETGVEAVTPAREFLLPRAADGQRGVRVKVV